MDRQRVRGNCIPRNAQPGLGLDLDQFAALRGQHAAEIFQGSRVSLGDESSFACFEHGVERGHGGAASAQGPGGAAIQCRFAQDHDLATQVDSGGELGGSAFDPRVGAADPDRLAFAEFGEIANWQPRRGQ
jgi:hypothetical protein